jgi:Undecaprenyl-phosphate glucose phosphotransferase
MRNNHSYLLQIFLVSSDFIIVNLSCLLSYFVLSFTSISTDEADSVNILILINIGWLFCSFINNLYTQPTFANVENVLRKTVRSILVFSAGLFLFLFLLYKNDAYKNLIVCFYFLMIILFGISRLYLTYLYEFVIKRAGLHKKIAIIGYNETSIQLAKYFQEHKQFFSFQGFFQSDKSGINVAPDGSFIHSIESCISMALEQNIHEIYSTVMPEEAPGIVELAALAEKHCIKLRFVPNHPLHINSEATYYTIQYFNTMPVISLLNEPLENIDSRIKKRFFDIIISFFVILFILSWLTPLLALFIKLSSPGPVFFIQKRSGRDNKPFWCFKFRSMRVNNESDERQASKKDNRITKIGAFIRKTSLDELPQFFNVFIGNMSLVGPRPHMLKHTELYGAFINRYMVRQFLKPGITGWAQVNGYRGETESPYLMQKRVEYDIWYMENWSLMLDIKILFMTIINIFKGEEKAY